MCKLDIKRGALEPCEYVQDTVKNFLDAMQRREFEKAQKYWNAWGAHTSKSATEGIVEQFGVSSDDWRLVSFNKDYGKAVETVGAHLRELITDIDPNKPVTSADINRFLHKYGANF